MVCGLNNGPLKESKKVERELEHQGRGICFYMYIYNCISDQQALNSPDYADLSMLGALLARRLPATNSGPSRC